MRRRRVRRMQMPSADHNVSARSETAVDAVTRDATARERRADGARRGMHGAARRERWMSDSMRTAITETKSAASDVQSVRCALSTLTPRPLLARERGADRPWAVRVRPSFERCRFTCQIWASPSSFHVSLHTLALRSHASRTRVSTRAAPAAVLTLTVCLYAHAASRELTFQHLLPTQNG